MILAHLADLHLGFRSYERAVGGRNVREGDVTDAFLRAVEEIVRVSPDVILIAGDLFDRPDPPPAALVTLTRGLASVREALPATPVLITAGPRDRPTCPEEPGVLGAIDTLPGVAAATDTPRSVRVDDLAVALLPHGAPGAEAVPDEGARWNVLVAHARMRTAPAGKRGRSRAASRGAWGDPERILRVDPAAWSYVALGGEHAPHAPLSRTCAGRARSSGSAGAPGTRRSRRRDSSPGTWRGGPHASIRFRAVRSSRSLPSACPPASPTGSAGGCGR